MDRESVEILGTYVDELLKSVVYPFLRVYPLTSQKNTGGWPIMPTKYSKKNMTPPANSTEIKQDHSLHDSFIHRSP
jgi:hypothetical protein